MSSRPSSRVSEKKNGNSRFSHIYIYSRKPHSYWYVVGESEQIGQALSAAYQMKVVSIFVACSVSGQRYHDNPLSAAALNREALSHCGHASWHACARPSLRERIRTNFKYDNCFRSLRLDFKYVRGIREECFDYFAVSSSLKILWTTFSLKIDTLFFYSNTNISISIPFFARVLPSLIYLTFYIFVKQILHLWVRIFF